MESQKVTSSPFLGFWALAQPKKDIGWKFCTHVDGI